MNMLLLASVIQAISGHVIRSSSTPEIEYGTEKMKLLAPPSGKVSSANNTMFDVRHAGTYIVHAGFPP